MKTAAKTAMVMLTGIVIAAIIKLFVKALKKTSSEKSLMKFSKPIKRGPPNLNLAAWLSWNKLLKKLLAMGYRVKTDKKIKVGNNSTQARMVAFHFLLMILFNNALLSEKKQGRKKKKKEK